MAEQVRADAVSVGDVVVLPTALGDRNLCVFQVITRTATIKFVGRTLDRLAESAGETHWGWPPDHIVERISRGV